MKQRRTDLAVEAQSLWRENAGEMTQLPGVRAREGERFGFPVHSVEILDEEGERSLGKPQGRYLTLTIDPLNRREEDLFSRGVNAVAAELSTLLDGIGEKDSVLVVGLGNRAITPDAIGPGVHDHILPTRHLVRQLPQYFGDFRPVFTLSPGVLGTTGMESGEVVRSLVETLRPDCVIAVDALASRGLDRVCTTIQLSDTGIAPGSGVGNHRHPLDREHLGIPVIAVGVPTVVDGRTMAADLLGCDDLPEMAETFVTPKEIDEQVAELSKLLGYGINMALQPGMTVEELELLI